VIKGGRANGEGTAQARPINAPYERINAPMTEQIPENRLQGKPIEQLANDAWAAYAATQKAICADPALLENEFFTALQDTAFARFIAMFEAV